MADNLTRADASFDREEIEAFLQRGQARAARERVLYEQDQEHIRFLTYKLDEAKRDRDRELAEVGRAAQQAQGQLRPGLVHNLLASLDDFTARLAELRLKIDDLSNQQVRKMLAALQEQSQRAATAVRGTEELAPPEDQATVSKAPVAAPKD